MVEIRFLCNVIDTRAQIDPCSHVTSRCCQSATPDMSPASHYSAYSNWSLATYPFFSLSKIQRTDQILTTIRTWHLLWVEPKSRSVQVLWIVKWSCYTVRNLSLIFLKHCLREEHITVIFKTTLIHVVIDFFSQIFEKIMQSMSQTSCSPKLLSFFSKFITSEILTLPEILFCHFEIILLM